MLNIKIHMKKLTTIIIVTVISLGLIITLPENIVSEGLVTFMVGIMIGSVMGEKPVGKSTVLILNSILYWILPAANLLLILFMFNFPSVIFYIIGIALVNVYKQMNKKSVSFKNS